MATDLLWAATDGSDGVSAVALPADRMSALALRVNHGGQFWCTTQASGCGGVLILAAGEVRRPYFRHHPGATCSFIGREHAAGPAYEHLLYQQALQAWLAGQGYTAVLEKRLGQDGRTDLYVVVDAVSHALEVQLSPISTTAWQQRDAGYRRQVDQVTWLYGPSAEAASAAELSVRGVAVRLRPGPQIGVLDLDGHTEWSDLTACRLTPAGLDAPGLAQARALAQQRQAEAEAEARQQQAELEAAQRRDLEQQQRWQAQSARRLTPTPAVISTAPATAGLDAWEARNPEARFWQPDRGWDWLDALPPTMHRAARSLTYTTQVLVFGSPTNTVLPELTDEEVRRELFDGLVDVGLVRRYLHPAGIERWERL